MKSVISNSLFDIRIYSDGASRGNPGPAASAFIVQDSQGHTLHQAGKFLGQATNNVAEYTAVLLALQWLVPYSSSEALAESRSRDQGRSSSSGPARSIKVESVVNFFIDSELIVKQLDGQYKIKSQNLKPLVIQIIRLVSHLRSRGVVVNFLHVRRHHNQDADLLANQILDQHLQ